MAEAILLVARPYLINNAFLPVCQGRANSCFSYSVAFGVCVCQRGENQLNRILSATLTQFICSGKRQTKIFPFFQGTKRIGGQSRKQELLSMNKEEGNSTWKGTQRTSSFTPIIATTYQGRANAIVARLWPGDMTRKLHPHEMSTLSVHQPDVGNN